MPTKDKNKLRLQRERYYSRPGNRERQRERVRAYYQRNRDKYIQIAREKYTEQKARFGRSKPYAMTNEEYKVLELKQLGVCALCGMAPETTFNVDHDHKTGKVRGLLCKKCNTGLGHFDDEPLLLQAAVEYLNEARKAA